MVGHFADPVGISDRCATKFLNYQSHERQAIRGATWHRRLFRHEQLDASVSARSRLAEHDLVHHSGDLRGHLRYQSGRRRVEFQEGNELSVVGEQRHSDVGQLALETSERRGQASAWFTMVLQRRRGIVDFHTSRPLGHADPRRLDTRTTQTGGSQPAQQLPTVDGACPVTQRSFPVDRIDVVVVSLKPKPARPDSPRRFMEFAVGLVAHQMSPAATSPGPNGFIHEHGHRRNGSCRSHPRFDGHRRAATRGRIMR